jgi:DNA-nicking Smr family endonuclease
MSGGRGKPPADWREGLKGLRDRLPGQKAPRGVAGRRTAPPPAVGAPQAAAPSPSAADEVDLFEREAAAQGIVKAAGAELAPDGDLASLPHAGGPAAGEARGPEAPSPASPPGGMARLKGDRRALPRKLDLHGRTLDSALSAVKVFLSQHRDLGGTEVVIVTGHGQSRAGAPVLRPEVEALLAQHPGVARVDPDGPGAFRVTLRPRRP